MDLTRKIYHRALSIPMEGLEQLWHAYDGYENSLNKLTAKKLVAEKSSAYMAARSATKELMDLIGEIDLDGYPLDPDSELTDAERRERLACWMKWLNWEKSNPLTLSNRPILHSRIIYAFRRALMSCRRDPLMWQAYATYLRIGVERLEDAETVLKQALRHCPLSSDLFLALADLKEAQGSDFGTIKVILDDFLCQASKRLDELKSEVVALRKTPIDNDDEVVFASALLDQDGPKVHAYLRLQNGFNAVQCAYIDMARRLEGLNAARGVFASARKSVHVSVAVFSAAAVLEFRIRKDPSIASKIYELGLSRFPNDYYFAREYLSFLLAQNDDSNVRALFERIIGNIESFRATHTREVIRKNEDRNVIMGIWRDFYVFERQIGDYQSIQKFEGRMRAALSDDFSLQQETLYHERLGLVRLEDYLESVEPAAPNEEQQFTLPRVHAKGDVVPFHLNEQLFLLFLKVNEGLLAKGIQQYDGPEIDVHRFMSFINRVSIPNADKLTPVRRVPSERPRYHHRDRDYQHHHQSSFSHSSRRRHREHEDERNRDFEEKPYKQPRSSIFEERRRQ